MPQPRPILRTLALLLVPAVFLAACGGSENGGGTSPGPTIESISLDPQTATLTTTGQTVSISATVLDSEGTTVSAGLSWTSSATGVATVNSSGVVTAVGNGIATVTASTSGVSASATITVNLEAASVTVSPTEHTLDVGETVTLSATVADASGASIPDAMPAWSSSDEAVATVTAGGVVSAVSGGTATITATVGGVSASAAITVNPEVATVVVSPAADTVDIGATITLTAAALDSEGAEVEGVSFTWESADASIATVDDSGVVTGAAGGTVEISASAEGVTGTAEVRVSPPDLVITEDTTLGGTVTVDEFVVEDGVTITLDSDFELRAEGSVRISGNVAGSCRGASVIAADSLVITSNVDLSCAAVPDDPGSVGMRLIGVGGVRLEGATIRASGAIDIGGLEFTSVEPDTVIAPAPALRASDSDLPDIVLLGTTIAIQPEKAVSAPPGSGADGTDGQNVNVIGRIGVSLLNAVVRAQNGGDGGSKEVTGPNPSARGGDGGRGGRIYIGVGQVSSNGVVREMTPSSATLVGNTLRAGRGGEAGNATAIADPSSLGDRGYGAVAVGGKGGSNGAVFLMVAGDPPVAQVEAVDGQSGGAALARGADGLPATENVVAQHGGHATAEGGDGGSGTAVLVNSVGFVGDLNQIAEVGARGAEGVGTAHSGSGGVGFSSLSHAPARDGGDGGDAHALSPGGMAILRGGNGGRGADFCPAPGSEVLEFLILLSSDPGNSNQFIFNVPEAGEPISLEVGLGAGGPGGDGGNGGEPRFSTWFDLDDEEGDLGQGQVESFGNGAEGGRGTPPGYGGQAFSSDPDEWYESTEDSNANVTSVTDSFADFSFLAADACTSNLVANGALLTEGRILSFSGDSPFIDISGALNEDNTFSMTAQGDMVGSTVTVTFEGTYDPETGTLDGLYSMDTEQVISEGHPLIYRIQSN